MKKIFNFMSIFIFALSLSTHAQASEAVFPQITYGYTENGIYYEVYGQTSLQPRSDSVYITRQITYKSEVDPPSKIVWEETVNGVTYRGTLNLMELHYIKNETIAIYQGTITAVK